MAKIKVNKLQVGMVLTADVCDPNGRFLLGEGCELNDKHLKALNAWGVISVEISDDDMPEDTVSVDLSPEALAEIENQVIQRFRHNEESIPFVELCTIFFILFLLFKN